jgi:hypothetical protein
MHSALAAVVLASALLDLGCTHGAAITVPFVGCPSDGQVGFIAAPTGAPQVVGIDRATALQLAYYKGENARGAFAPRGWHCQVWYGSAGSRILISPTTIDSGKFDPLFLRSPAVELSMLDGGTSGRFAVARYASRLFPKVAADFIQGVKAEGIEPASAFDQGRYANDSIRYADSLSLEFMTPATKAGIGTEGDLAPSRDPVSGFVTLDPVNDWGLALLRVRVGADMAGIAAAIVKLNRECLGKDRC